MTGGSSESATDRAARFSRQLVLPEIGQDGTKRLAAARVAIVGCGGLGTPVVQYLAAAGIGRLTVIDDDVVELSNLNRQTLHRASDVGRLKAERAAEFVADLDSQIAISIMADRITTQNAREMCATHDLVMDCTDGAANKYLLNDACILEKTTLVHGSVTAFSGQMMIVSEGKGPCLRCLFPVIPDGPAVPSCQQAGVLGAACGIVGSMMALEAIKVLCGMHVEYRRKYVAIDLFFGTVSTVTTDARTDCPACGTSARLDARNPSDYVAHCQI
jgi:adenylyltransferase/sulfurtransferase